VAATGLLLDCELPVGREGALVHNELVLSGWAVSPIGISGIAVQIGDRVWNASYGLDTPGLAERVGDLPNVARAGYHLRIDTSDWTPGPHYVTVAAFDLEGGRDAIEGPVEVQPFERASDPGIGAVPASDQETAIQLDEPLAAEGSREVTLPLRVTGWATAPSGVESVVVTVDGETRYEALRPIARPDLLGRHGPEIAGEAGFALELAPADCPPGPHTLAVVARARDGGTAGVAREVLCRAPTTPELRADAPIAWIEDHGDPPVDRARDPEVETLVAMWEDRATLAEADAAASRAEARFAQKRQEEALRAQRAAEEEVERQRAEVESARAELFAAPRPTTVRLALEHNARYAWAATVAAATRVLDVGCGTGAGTARLAEHAHTAVGVDVSPGAIEDARSSHGDEASFHEGDMRDLPFEAGEFDVVVCFEALTHVAETQLALDELRRVLRPGGTLLVSAPNPNAYPAGNPLHQVELTIEELARSLAARFPNVATYRQQTYFASLLGGAATIEHEDPRVQIEAGVTKLLGTPAGEELYRVAVATDAAALPPEPARLVLGGQLDYEEQASQLLAWQRRAIEAETDALVLRRLQD
jgi:2-polyprenyl-3-methyl-5-hydroxy-6-metoxy-1,4-benzoquinol methylase